MMVRLIAAILVVLMLGALFVGGELSTGGLVPPPWDKLAHVAFFFVFALLLARFVGLPIALVIVLALVVGAADELHQFWLPGRTAGWDDWLADGVGAGLGLIRFKR